MALKATPETVVARWSTLIDNFQQSPLAFYQAVEEALKARQIPETTNSRITFKEGGLLSADRQYLHVTREKLVFDICGAPFGTGFFVSWWLAEAKVTLDAGMKTLVLLGIAIVWYWLTVAAGLILGSVAFGVVIVVGLAIANSVAGDGSFDDGIIRALPLIGRLYEWLFKPETYFRVDSRLMFQEAVHRAVLEVIDGMTAQKGLRALTEMERKPIMREFYRKAA